MFTVRSVVCDRFLLFFLIWLKGGDGVWPDPLQRPQRATASGASYSERSELKLADASVRVPETCD